MLAQTFQPVWGRSTRIVTRRQSQPGSFAIQVDKTIISVGQRISEGNLHRPGLAGSQFRKFLHKWCHGHVGIVARKPRCGSGEKEKGCGKKLEKVRRKGLTIRYHYDDIGHDGSTNRTPDRAGETATDSTESDASREPERAIQCLRQARSPLAE